MPETAISQSHRHPIYSVAYWRDRLSQREDQVFLALTILIGALAGLAVVAFILLTERLGARLFPPGVGRLRSALARCEITGVATTTAMHASLVAQDEFARGGVDTGYLARFLDRDRFAGGLRG